MDTLDSLIAFENEHTTLDFKLEEYSKHKTFNLIKDVMAMANAEASGDRYIVIGMKPGPEGRNVVGLKSITDSASLQKTIIDNVEPEIHLDYFGHNYQGKMLGVIRISKCDQRPYLMKKDYGGKEGTLKRGEGYVRMGSTQMLLFRSHYEKIYAQRYQNQKYSGEVKISFDRNHEVNTLNVFGVKLKEEDIPSSIEAKEIQKIIEEKVKDIEYHNRLGLRRDEDYIDPMVLLRTSQFRALGRSGTSYEERSISTLRENLKNVTKTYADEDGYYILEKQAEHINFYVKNIGTSYLKDAKLILRFPKNESYMLAEDLPKDPEDNMPVIRSGYPYVELVGDSYEVSEDLGDLKQHLNVKAFAEAIRIFLSVKHSPDYTIPIETQLFASNLDEPICSTLSIVVSDRSLPDEVD